MPFKCIAPEELYARDSNLKKSDLEILQEWLKKQPHLPKLHDSQILLCLHSCYYKVEAAKVTIDNYFTCRSLCSEIFTPMSPELIKATTAVTLIDILPEKTPERCDILMFKLLDSNSDNFNCTNVVNLVNMVSCLYVHQHGTDGGAVAIFDMQGFTLSHVTKLNVNVLKKALYFLQEAVPIRIKGIHVINCYSLIDKIMFIIKPFLKSELYDLIQFHPPNSDTLYKSIPKDCLPEEYGGKAPSTVVLNEQNLRNILDNYDFYKWHDGQKVDESKRMVKSKIVNDVFGIEGTFKKLDID